MRCVLGLLLCAVLSPASGSDLPPAVARVLDGHGIPHSAVSIIVQAADSAEPLVSHLPHVPRNPASVMKLVVTWAALEILGPAYQWRTEVYFLGDFDGKTLDGDLALKGYGDPYFVAEELWKLQKALRRVGLEDVRGDLVLDDSYFHVAEDPPGAFDGQPFRAYNVLPNALLVNFKAVGFQFYPDPVNNRVRIATDPVLGNLDIRNGLELVDGPCRGYQAGISINIPDPEAAARAVFTGQFPARCRYYELNRTVLQHDTYAFGLFDTLWKETGGQLRGRVRSDVVPEGAAPAMTWRSAPLGDVIRKINKNSNNVMTRQLLYTLGAEQLGPPGTKDKGIEIVRNALSARALPLDSLVIGNGAGLSRDERVSAQLLADMLRTAHGGAHASEFISSLSLGGLDGTTRTRFRGHAEMGRAHLKTGRLDHVSCVAGYVHASDGKTYVVAALLNAPDAHRGPGEELQHALIHWVHSQS
jgi:D-alanyl-D-alanine carboxypeptidase/D-alanyl-D-alanine-endopeptidase (penicillin-binding protein 4)